MTVREAIRRMTRAMGVVPWKGTVDTLKHGRHSDAVRGIVTTFMPTHEVLGKAARVDANLVICHEPLRYSHRDETDWLRGDPVAAAKKRLLDRHRIAVYRTHDTWHARKPDGIMEGQMIALGWTRYQRPAGSAILAFPRWPVRRIAAAAKRRLGARSVRVVGDPGLVPRRVFYHSGFAGGRSIVGSLRSPAIEAVVCGEDHEWESYEWVRDAAAQGRRKALIVLGHCASEEAGMAHLARWLRDVLPGIPVRHIPSGAPYRLL